MKTQFKYQCIQKLNKHPEEYLVDFIKQDTLQFNIKMFNIDHVSFITPLLSLPLKKITILVQQQEQQTTQNKHTLNQQNIHYHHQRQRQRLLNNTTTKSNQQQQPQQKQQKQLQQFIKQFFKKLNNVLFKSKLLRSLTFLNLLNHLPITCLKQLNSGIQQSKYLKQLKFIKCNLTDQHIEIIKSSIERNVSLISLDFQNNLLSTNCGGMFGKILSVHSQRRTEIMWIYSMRDERPDFDISNAGICQLSLKGNKLDNKSALDLVTFLKDDKWCKKININSNNIEQEGIKQFALMLKNNSSLLSLDLRGNPGMTKQFSKYIYKKLLNNMERYKSRVVQMKSHKEDNKASHFSSLLSPFKFNKTAFQKAKEQQQNKQHSLPSVDDDSQHQQQQIYFLNLNMSNKCKRQIVDLPKRQKKHENSRQKQQKFNQLSQRLKQKGLRSHRKSQPTSMKVDFASSTIVSSKKTENSEDRVTLPPKKTIYQLNLPKLQRTNKQSLTTFQCQSFPKKQQIQSSKNNSINNSKDLNHNHNSSSNNNSKIYQRNINHNQSNNQIIITENTENQLLQQISHHTNNQKSHHNECKICVQKTLKLLRSEKQNIQLELQLRRLKHLIAKNVEMSGIGSISIINKLGVGGGNNLQIIGPGAGNNPNPNAQHQSSMLSSASFNKYISSVGQNDDEMMSKMEMIMSELTKIMEAAELQHNTQNTIEHVFSNVNSLSNTVNLYQRPSQIEQLDREIFENQDLNISNLSENG